MNNIIIYKNGFIYTVDKKQTVCDAMAIKNDTIVAVGRENYVQNKVAKIIEPEDIVHHIDLQGKMILPGFIEAHAHPSFASLEMLYQVDLNNCQNADEYAKRIKKFYIENPDADFIIGAGWINPHFDIHGPRKEVLDEISEDIPIIMWSGDHHSVWANSKAIGHAHVSCDTTSPPGGIIEKDEQSGEPTGTFREIAQNLILDIVPKYTLEQCEKAILHYQKSMAKYGFTMSHDAMLDLDSIQHRAFESLDKNDNLLFKMTASITTSPNTIEGLSEYRSKVDKRNGKRFKANHIKFFLDGVVEGKTAYLKRPYVTEDSYRGEKMWDDEKLQNALSIVDRDKFETHFHIIGDAAAAQMIDALSVLETINGKRDRRIIAAHTQIVDPVDIKKMADYNEIIICANPYWFIKEPGYYNGIELPLLGKDRVENEYPMKSFLDSGMVIASASDFSVTPDPNPLVGIQFGVQRKLPDMDDDMILGAHERVSVEEMVKTFTINAAYAISMENDTGSIEEGKMADIVILEKNIFDVPEDEIYKVEVIQTLSEGKIIYSKA